MSERDKLQLQVMIYGSMFALLTRTFDLLFKGAMAKPAQDFVIQTLAVCFIGTLAMTVLLTLAMLYLVITRPRPVGAKTKP